MNAAVLAVAENVVYAESIFEKINNLAADAETSLKIITGVIAIGFIVWRGIRAKGAIGAIIVAGIAAALFTWLVFSGIDTLKENANDTLSLGRTGEVPAVVVVPPDGIELA